MKNLNQKVEIEGSARLYEDVHRGANNPGRYFIEMDSSVISLFNTELGIAAKDAGYSIYDCFKYKIIVEIEPKEKS